ncbi:MAG: hypothetical protein QOC70_1269, partial [Verrucomicrobiota bacterium]
AKESTRKRGPIRGQPNQKLGDLIAPLGDQLEPKPGQDRKFPEEGKEPFTRFFSEKFTLCEFRISLFRWETDRSQGQTVALLFQFKTGTCYPLEDLLKISF